MKLVDVGEISNIGKTGGMRKAPSRGLGKSFE
jgi:hypothetical protein